MTESVGLARGRTQVWCPFQIPFLTFSYTVLSLQLVVMSFTRIQIYQLSLLFCYIQQCYSACYLPNGTMVGIDPDGGAYVPCDIDGGMCCALGRPSTSRFVDYCRSDGLCESPGSGDVYRESCSDPTWKDPRCLKLCVDEGTSILYIWVGRV